MATDIKIIDLRGDRRRARFDDRASRNDGNRWYLCRHGIDEYNDACDTCDEFPELMDNLARNLAVAGALCAAWEIGAISVATGNLLLSSWVSSAKFKVWIPGSQRLAPGFKP